MELKEERPFLWRDFKRSGGRYVWDSYPFEAPLYTHWFPMFAYDMYKKTKISGRQEIIEVKISDGSVKALPAENIEQPRFVNKLQFLDGETEPKALLDSFTQAIEKIHWQ